MCPRHRAGLPGPPESAPSARAGRSVSSLLVAVALGTGGAPLLGQNDGFADPTFGNYAPGFSVVAFDLGAGLMDDAHAVAVGSYGAILVAGGAIAPGPPVHDDVALARMRPDGTADNNFNFGGQLHWDFLSLGFSATFNAVGELSDHTLVAAGTAYGSGISYPIAALVNQSGVILDERLFGFGNWAGFSALAVQPDDKIVLAGYVDRGINYAFLVERLNPDFSIDLAFGNHGEVIVDFDLTSFDDDLAYAVTVQRDGNIVVAGSAQYDNNDTDMAVLRLTPSGALDPTFGTGGKVTAFFDLSATDKRDAARAVAVDRLGRIYLAGSAQMDSAPFSRAAFVRLDPDGAADLTFGNFGNGRARFTNLDNVLNVATGAAVQDDNLLVACGTGAPGTARKLSALRLTESGALDAAWGGGQGVVAYNLYYSGAADIGAAVALQGGRAIVAGSADVNNVDSNTNFVVMRLDATLAFEDDFELADTKLWSAKSP